MVSRVLPSPVIRLKNYCNYGLLFLLGETKSKFYSDLRRQKVENYGPTRSRGGLQYYFQFLFSLFILGCLYFLTK